MLSVTNHNGYIFWYEIDMSGNIDLINSYDADGMSLDSYFRHEVINQMFEDALIDEADQQQ